MLRQKLHLLLPLEAVKVVEDRREVDPRVRRARSRPARPNLRHKAVYHAGRRLGHAPRHQRLLKRTQQRRRARCTRHQPTTRRRRGHGRSGTARRCQSAQRRHGQSPRCRPVRRRRRRCAGHAIAINRHFWSWRRGLRRNPGVPTRAPVAVPAPTPRARYQHLATGVTSHVVAVQGHAVSIHILHAIACQDATPARIRMPCPPVLGTVSVQRNGKRCRRRGGRRP